MKATNYLVAALLASTTLISPISAHAEGFFETRLDGVRTGFITRSWNDRNYDGYNTEITAANCLNNPHGSPGRVEFTLKKKIPVLPDHDLGTRTLNGCYREWDRGNWGRVAAGDYYAVVGTFDWNRLTINWLKVVY
ncbi:hypothetical protein NY035_00945 [Corynebacterium diphtheriae bv. mitis]|uniref:hypothetical protein n=1 Tax=Corynebacterium diphtheriae TaxID=1717 RepID=UPI00024685AA|nr:hypothetical protein [Corynebacterium diphtheriae]AEX76360.1 hypothetical protein CDHC02_0868 [Corynebacterium diphtheriae HC02]UWE97267.1 hypothetical protein NY039_04680 [Corynebacterium diphtheriae bv. mitis]UWE98802.1 hypothetical protein NY040_00950 [Corynebacterium diphtheriae bv. mitis]UWE99997.1 hypothetical protein NY052_06530 [Corynebacterium diphtheriae bv. mitis]UWF13506.1 hypothetical protein NY028_00950 [Corynebacterium diphtheriae bv. mitis]